MKKIFILMLGMFFLFSLVSAAEGDTISQRGIQIIPRGSNYQDFEEDEYDMYFDEEMLMEGERARLWAGEYILEKGERVRVQTESNNQMRLSVDGREAVSTMNMNQEMVNGQIRLSAELSNGRNAEIMVMPDVASEKALERLRLKVCLEENGCTIELKEVQTREGSRVAYELETERTSRVLGLFKTRMQVKAQVDAETGEVLQVKKPWWAFLATEPKE